MSVGQRNGGDKFVEGRLLGGDGYVALPHNGGLWLRSLYHEPCSDGQQLIVERLATDIDGFEAFYVIGIPVTGYVNAMVVVINNGKPTGIVAHRYFERLLRLLACGVCGGHLHTVHSILAVAVGEVFVLLRSESERERPIGFDGQSAFADKKPATIMLVTNIFYPVGISKPLRQGIGHRIGRNGGAAA